MPAASAYRRAPLVNPAYVPLSDAALHPEGPMKARIQQVLNMVSPRHMSTLDSVLATKLGGYAQLPPMPDVEAAAALLPADPSRFVEIVWSASMLAAMSRDKEGMLRVLGAVRAFAQVLPQLSEKALFACGADALRLTVDLYRRTGQPFLLNLLETMRGQLPDVSGLMHMFPFQREYRRESQGNTPEEKAFYDRMDRFAMGKGAADALAMTVFLGQYSGSGRDAAAPLTGLNALNRYHGMPCGAFAADPYLAGRDPARAVELDALCAQIEAYADALCFTGENAFAERLELPLAIVDKRRPRANVSKVMNIIGEVEGRDVVIVDDMIDTAGTLCNAAGAIKARGAKSVTACATHGVLSGPAIGRIRDSALDEVVLLDTIALPPEKQIEKIKVLSVAPVLAEAVARIYSDKPVSTLFV